MVSSRPSSRRSAAPKRLATFRRYRGSRRGPPLWSLMIVLAGLSVVAAVLVVCFLGPARQSAPVADASAQPSASPSAEPAATSSPALTSLADPVTLPTPSADLSSAAETSPAQTDAPVPGEVDQPSAPIVPVDCDDWFSDAVFIGDSRTDGLRLYSGITSNAVFLVHTGLSIYDVNKGKAVISLGSQTVSVLDALSAGTYKKVYIALGVNELGYFDPEGFARTYGNVVDAIRKRQPGARIYIQLLIPVNTEQCRANHSPYYVTNEGIANYNEALTAYFAGSDVYLLGIPEDLIDESGELRTEYSADGVHFKTDGYVLWLNYLAAHTEG